MNFNKLLKSLFGDKSSRDMKLIQPIVEKVKAVYPEVEKLSNDSLRARTQQIRQEVQGAAQSQKDQIADVLRFARWRILCRSWLVQSLCGQGHPYPIRTHASERENAH